MEYVQRQTKDSHYLSINTLIRPKKDTQGFFNPIAQRKKQERPDMANTMIQRIPNQTGLPDQLKTGVENRSGFSMDNVRVYYNSQKPAQMQSLAYTQGTDIHVGPGQEKHLPHEAWHIVQQMQGRVRPTFQMKGMAVNDDAGLEREAEETGRKAVQFKESTAGEVHTQLLSGPNRESTEVVQRKVGFEFEDGNWKSWKKERHLLFFTNIRPANRKELLHQGTRFRLEADDTHRADAGYSDIEFVTEPFEPTDAGINRLNTAMGEIRDIMDRIGPYAGRNERENQYVQADEHGFSENNTLLSGGDPEGKFKMQATQGVSLEDLPTVLEYFGSNVPGETPIQGAVRWEARKMQSGDTGHQAKITNVMGNVPTLARNAVQHLLHNGLGLTHEQKGVFDNATPEHLTGPLIGLLTEIILYVKVFSRNEGGYVKYYLPFMARNDLVTLFRLIPPEQQAVLAVNDAQAFIDAVVTVVNSNQLIEYQHSGIFFDQGFAADSSLLRSFRPQNEPLRRMEGPIQRTYPVFHTLSIGEWLRGITLGIDHLTPDQMGQWLRDHEPGLTEADRNRHLGYLESVASYGNETDAPDRPGNTRMGIFENRAIAPVGNPPLSRTGELTAIQCHKAALNYLMFFKNLKDRGGIPGDYPNIDPPF